MPSREKRAMRRRRGYGVLSALIVILMLVAAALVVILVNGGAQPDAQGGNVAIRPDATDFVDSRSATPEPLVLGADLQTATAQVSQESAEPLDTGDTEPVAEPEPTAAQSTDNRLIPEVLPGDYFLPIFDRALRTPDDEMMIAITVDDCNDPEVLSQIVGIAQRYDAKLTLFPTGEALMTEGMGEGFRTCVLRYGYELENHSYSHKKEYQLSNGELALQLWKQSIAASYVVGKDYEQHFYRPYYDNSKYDQRTHFFINKLGYAGVASYTYSYKGMTAEQLIDTLENGNIYQFDMTEKSMEVFETFIQEASRKGYKLVTMNKLFGLNEDVVGDKLTIDQQTLPTMDDYVSTYYDLKLNYRTNAVYSLQARLAELGYLTDEAAKPDGLYGANTSIAVSAFQAKIGEAATGNASVNTQERLFALNAPLAG
ncbi:MAG: peptidoglycan-binding protein [Clostridia bacterium]|nr:peptidoglycan-binding protein [Clostridia bacterium]